MSCFDMPMPLSITCRYAVGPSRSTRTRTRPPVGVYFAALVTRLTMTCVSRVASPSTAMGSSRTASSSE